ncbi:MAG: hypothetical protein O8C64_11075 [Candidatus Methanoperedens sp.]|nr:hypothetical protein [Candidatus Methanoperedens sp.]MCZ7404369.1 hypothetical protein [Candidatus Methanoperedens sp.]
MNNQKSKLIIIAIFIAGLVIGFSFHGMITLWFQNSSVHEKPLDERYQEAIKDAMVAEKNEVYNNLVPIVETNTNLSWQGEPGNKSVLVVAFTKFTSSYPVNESVTTRWGYTWVTVSPEIKTFFKNDVDRNSNFSLRVKQLLGLPEDNDNSYFVELWVKPESLFRPSPDNEINDTTAQLTFPDSTDPDYKKWFNDNIIYSYFPVRYPWTRLGYTYDWGNPNSEIGLSEFVIKINSTVVVKSVTPINDYLIRG